MSEPLKSGDLVELLRDLTVERAGRKFHYEEGTELRFIRAGKQPGTSELFDGEQNLVVVPDSAFAPIDDEDWE